MHVRNDRRRRGVGRAIVESAAQFAHDVAADYVTVGVFPGSRETNRYFARLGFSPLVMRRAVPTTQLEKRLAGDQDRPAERGPHTLPMYVYEAGLVFHRAALQERSVKK